MPKFEDRDRKESRTRFIIVSVFVAILLIVVWGNHYFSENQRYWRLNVIKVDDTTIRMDYFLKRTKLDGRAPMAMLRILTQEELITLGAARYGIEATTEDIAQEVRRIAGGGSETISEAEFRAWLRQILNVTRLSETEYKDIVATSLLTARLREYLVARMPTVAEQVHLYILMVKTEEEAEKIRTRWAGGEDFAKLAREVSLDEESRQKGGELGWFPRNSGALDPQIEYEAFRLDVGQVSEPIPLIKEVPTGGELLPTIEGYRLIMVAEKADAREVDEKYLPILRDRVLEEWLSEEWKLHNVEWHGLQNGFDSYTDAWMNLQLQKK